MPASYCHHHSIKDRWKYCPFLLLLAKLRKRKRSLALIYGPAQSLLFARVQSHTHTNPPLGPSRSTTAVLGPVNQYLSLWACVYYLCCILFLPNNQQPTLDPHPPPPRSHSQVTHPSWLSVKPGRGSPLLRHQLSAVTHGGGPASEIETVRTELLIDQSSPAMAEH